MSVFPEGPDPVTGARQLEEIAFEVLDTESLDHVTAKTRRLAKRGVRRLFYLRVADHTVHEWQHATSAWLPLDAESEIRDRCFVVPIPVRAFVRRVLAHDTVARALVATGNPVIITAVNAARDEGHLEGVRASLLRVAARRGLSLSDAQRGRIAACAEIETLQTWIENAAVAESADDVFG